MMDGIQRRHQKLDDKRFRLEKAQSQLLQGAHRRWETISAAIRHYDARRRLASVRQQLDAQVTNLAAATHRQLAENRSLLERRIASLEALSPVAILNRGYALVFDASGNLVKDASQVAAGDPISTRLARGRLQARVTSTDSATSDSGTQH
jgi:exodeoxyribonuclease VII large subunit